MKIALLDLNHKTRGIHTNTVPLGIGLISFYLKNNIERQPDIKIFKDTDTALDTFRTWKPDVLGIAQYLWNSRLNLYAARQVREANPGCLIVAGGPNLEQSEAGKVEFFKENDHIDVCVAYDGEIPFLEIVKRLLSGETTADLRANPAAGTYALHPDSSELIESSGPPPRLTSLDDFGTPYSEGVFDEFLDAGNHPFVQTHRGCPFRCTYCHTSDSYYSKMLFLSPELFRKDFEYLAKRFKGKQNVPLFIANTNWSLFKEDFEIARVIKEIKEKYDWPHQVHINSGKDPKKLLDMLTIFRHLPGIALQTLTPSVLKTINRVNIPFEEYVEFQNKVSVKTGRPSATDLILCLPGETKETFMETMTKTIDSGTQNIMVYTLMKLKGTPLGSEENIKRYEHIVRHRVVPRQFSQINGTKIFDTEEVVVGTNTMSFDDYIELRSLCFTVAAFLASSELIPLVKLISEYDIRISKWIFNIQEQLPNYPNIFEHYKGFLQETRDELFTSYEELVDFFSKPENYEALYTGKLGDNLLRKYKFAVLFESYNSLLHLAVSEAEKLMVEHVNEEKAKAIVGSIKRYLSTRDMKSILKKKISFKEKTVQLDYDVPGWLSNSGKDTSIENFYTPSNYTVKLPGKALKEWDNITALAKDLELSLQVLYRDGTIKAFWPEWHRQD